VEASTLAEIRHGDTQTMICNIVLCNIDAIFANIWNN